MKETLTLIDTFGGILNIVDVEPCSLCIRAEVKSQRETDEAVLRIPPTLAIACLSSFVQVTVGSESGVIVYKMGEQISPPRGLTQKSEESLSLYPLRAPPSVLVAHFRFRVRQSSSLSLRGARRML